MLNPAMLLIFLISRTICQQMPNEPASQILNPQLLRDYMFHFQISGKLSVLKPARTNTHKCGKIKSEEYVVEMRKTTQQILPPPYGKTTIYAYGGNTTKGYYLGFPGPAIIAKKDRQVRVTWRNLIPGPHILPIDFNFPFINSSAFRDEVPTVTHVHGMFVQTNSDGGPEAYFTKSGQRGMHYFTAEKTCPNSAVYVYPNEQNAANLWFHDHAFGITRLNVYAGLVGFYKILDSKSVKQQQIVNRFGVSEDQTKYLVVTDKTFKTNGELFYGGEVTNPNFDSWVPEFFGNTMLVNGVIWPKMILKPTIHRFVFLNGCQSRFLNIWFENNENKIPFQLIRVDGDFYNEPVTVQKLLATISSRIEFILDLTGVEGEVILKNDAPGPYPKGMAENFNEEFNGNIMKMIVDPPRKSCNLKAYYNWRKQICSRSSNIEYKFMYDKISSSSSRREKYPKFGPGQKVFMTLFEVMNGEEVDAAFINGISMSSQMGMGCPNSTYKVGKTYDFYFINLTPDAHPIHFHLINMQKVKQFKFNVDKYAMRYFDINGGMPTIKGWDKAPLSLDPEEGFRTGADEFPRPDEKIFTDTINAFPGYVTVMRVKFAKNDGSLARTFDMRGQKYVMHCHILEHEDNTMMINYCLQ